MVAKLRDMAALSFLIHTKDIPKEITLNDHSLSFIGSQESLFDAENIITGVYGAYSKQVALVMASRWSSDRVGKEGLNRILMLDVNYKIDNYSLTREQTRKDILEQTGWLHMDRMATSLRKEVKAQWLDWIDQESPIGVAQRLEDESLNDIAVKYPKYVRRMMAENPSIRGIVHPVNPVLEPTACIWAASVRYEAERFHGANVRFLRQVEVIL